VRPKGPTKYIFAKRQKESGGKVLGAVVVLVP